MRAGVPDRIAIAGRGYVRALITSYPGALSANSTVQIWPRRHFRSYTRVDQLQFSLVLSTY